MHAHDTAPPPAAMNLAGIDLLRFASALAVLFWHYQHFSFVGAVPFEFDNREEPFYGALSMFYHYGKFGVQVFWSISGFIFFWKYGEAIAAGRIQAGRFALLRFSRLYPLHLLTLLLVALGQLLFRASHPAYFVYQDNSLASFFLQLGVIGHWFYPLLSSVSFNGPIWSVALELLAYLLFFLLSRRIGVGARATLATVALLALGHYGTGLPAFECLLFFYLGGVVWLAARRAALWSRRRRQIVNGAVALLFLATCAAVRLRLVWADHVVVPMVPLLVYVFLQGVQPVSARLRRVFGELGNLTYASYLLHFPLQLYIALACGWLGREVPWRSPWLFIGFVTATMLLSYWCYRHVERPLQDWIRGRWGAPAGLTKPLGGSAAPV
ncbi:acyltransferase [Massilia atriviolacea]|uniref:Acyltransferase n=1 Tax=Massilia atriviolacea TaxID=2495579 RepID=A0A430HEN5_9BURK|nr:acyltransferase [Massilia atriviolacea]RSZ55969.1 acyltransferase [Massilia atriviolacea]